MLTSSSQPTRAIHFDDQQMLIEEEHLSQQMQNLSTRTTVNKESPVKQILINMNKLPKYLTKRNESFRQVIQQALSSMALSVTNDNMESLRKIAHSIYQIMFIQTYHALWAAYLKSGRGQLIQQSVEQMIYSVNLPIWPKEIKRMAKSGNTKSVNEEDICMELVEHTLHELDHQLKHCQAALTVQANNVPNYCLIIQNMIETYIEKNLRSLRMNIELQIELVYHDYHIQALQLEYERHHPNAAQKQLMNNLCHCKYQQETSEQEYNLLRQQIAYHNSPDQSLECSSMSNCTTIESIQNPEIRRQLIQHFKDIAEQSRLKMFRLYLKTAEEERNIYKKKYDTEEKKMWIDRRMALDQEKIPSIMITLIEQRCSKMSDRIKCIYKYRAQLIGTESLVHK